MKQIGLSISQYAQDYDEGLPPTRPIINGVPTNVAQADTSQPGSHFYTCADGVTPGLWVSWMDIINPYVKSWKVFECPSAYTNVQCSYGYNWYVSGARTDWISLPVNVPIKLAQMSKPAECVMILDYNISYGSYANPYEPPTVGWLLPYIAVHSNGSNVCFADGHVKWMALTSSLYQPPNWVNPMWNPLTP